VKLAAKNAKGREEKEKRRRYENYKFKITNYKLFFGNEVQIIPMG
jgi:hypothetical protein